jgi:ribonuclease D
MTLITENDALQAFCDSLVGAAYITVDTEFLREKTYWPQLCLLQIGGPDDAVAVDALADGIDLSPVYKLFDDPSILKIFHAGRQDLEIFYNLTGRLPVPVFDSQVAAMVCGFGDSIGYEHLVGKLAGKRVDKSSRFTDWSLRPLSQKQIDYAISDVTHLRPVYEKLAAKLEANGRSEWIDEEMATLTRLETYANQPENAYKRIKGRAPSARYLAVLRELAAWREHEAQRRDVPRNRVLRDEALVEIAHHTPDSVAQLSRTRGLGAKTAEGRYGRELLEAVQKGKSVPDSDCPIPKEKRDLPRGLGPVTDILKVLLKMKCEQFDVAGKLLANSADVEQIAAFGEEADVASLKGWRREVFGDDALRLCQGELALVINGKRLKLVPQVTDDQT